MNDTVALDQHQSEKNQTATLGFWIYLMTDCLLFATLFATYIVLHSGTANGPTSAEIFDLPFVLVETIILLTSSYTCGLAVLAAKQNRAKLASGLIVATLALGVIFLGMELYEFNHLIHEGYTWQTSAFLSAFFTLVATHGLHIFVGILWASVLLWQIRVKGLQRNIQKLALFSIFWHFLDIVWIFIFTYVYLMGVL